MAYTVLIDTVLQLNPENIIIKDSIYLCEDLQIKRSSNISNWNR